MPYRSRTITDSPALLENGEFLVPISEVGKLFPKERPRATVEGWMRNGVRGVMLESLCIGSQRFSSKEAVGRFILGQLNLPSIPAKTKPGKTARTSAPKVAAPKTSPKTSGRMTPAEVSETLSRFGIE